MNRLLGPFGIALAALLFIAANSFVIVPQTQQALVLQFGAVRGSFNGGDNPQYGPGLHVKTPFVQNVVTFDKRNLGFNLQEERVTAADQEQLVVDAFVRWRIVDPRRFYEQAQNQEAGEARLRGILQTSLRRVLGRANRIDIISARRGELMREIVTEVGQAATGFGVQIIDVRIRQADLPQEVQERAFERMRTERQQVAAKLRAEGDEQASKITAEAERTRTVTIATAREEAEKIAGLGDAERTKIFASSFGRDPEFAAFYRSMQAYERAMPKGTQMVVPPEGEFFRYMRNQGGGGR
jgi:membrane protease subunit HflC